MKKFSARHSDFLGVKKSDLRNQWFRASNKACVKMRFWSINSHTILLNPLIFFLFIHKTQKSYFKFKATRIYLLVTNKHLTDKMRSKLAKKFLSAFQLTLSVLVFWNTNCGIVSSSEALRSISSLESLKILDKVEPSFLLNS